ncbi:MAG: phosphoribosylanthranilate isomerase [Rhodobacteraceae bacterium]|nr:phosphoribosylanthranilate isomerase [Paracoccaceae bacterium]MCY4197350.1 phosphoribosylanthranilate isomerase [Paracoccaceae bacterium]MCY4327150.1 phosphoribosylanthranilate isomerase [Paracoccaceae bacterium]
MAGHHVQVKICGLCRPDDVESAIVAGAAYIGFVFYPRSPRSLSSVEAQSLARRAGDTRKVALFVDANDHEIDEIVTAIEPDLLQLHGNETPERVAAIRRRFAIPVMKAVGVRTKGDLDVAGTYLDVVDQLLLDAKPEPDDSLMPGGNGIGFDWHLLEGWGSPIPWMLAGGLNPGNVREAVRISGAQQVDVSSGVESAPGMKSAQLMMQFVEQADGGAHAE